CVHHRHRHLLLIHIHRPLLHLHSFPTRRSSDLPPGLYPQGGRLHTGKGRHDRAPADLEVERSRNGMNRVPNSLCFQTSSIHAPRSEEHTSELQSRFAPVCRLLLEKITTSTPSLS